MRYSDVHLQAGRIRQCLAGTRLAADPCAVGMPEFRRRLPASSEQRLLINLRPAGVLVPLLTRDDGLHVLLTERASHLRHHAGQISFPGGGMEPDDHDIAATALREAYEETGIQPKQVDIAGYLAPTLTITGFAVTPVIGFITEPINLTLDPAEVESAFEVPLAFLMDVANAAVSEREFDGVQVPVISFEFAGHRIWGATASILITLRDILRLR